MNIGSEPVHKDLSLHKDLAHLLCPRSIAIVGASERSGAGLNVIENLQLIGFTGRIFPINPNYTELHGLPCYPSITAVPLSEKIDCVAILLSGQMIMPVLQQAAARKVRAAWAFASGFAEVGDGGGQMQAELALFCQRNDIVFCGPNCVGFVNLHADSCACSAPLPFPMRKGRISAVAQSGAVILAIANSNRNLGFSHLISSGNEAVLDVSDYLDYLVDDPHTDVIIAFIEAIRRPQGFQQACHRATKINKPIIAVKVGRTELARSAALTHTGSLAGAEEILDAFLRRSGVHRVNSIDELLETAAAFAQLKDLLPRGNRVGLITVSGGELGLIADQMQGLPLRFGEISEASQAKLRSLLPAYSTVSNPLDAWGTGDLEKVYPECIETLSLDSGVDMVLVSQDVPAGMAPKQTRQFCDVARAAVRAREISSKPVVLFSNVSGGVEPTIQHILDEGGVPCLQGTNEALQAAAALAEHVDHQNRLRSAVPMAPSPEGLGQLKVQLRGCKGQLPYLWTVEVLKAFGISVINEHLVHQYTEALTAMRSLGTAVALKVVSRSIPHKTETGLIQLGIASVEELDAAWVRLNAQLEKYHPAVEIEGILVQPMAPPGSVEAFVGVVRDDAFGPAVMVGLGGIFVELLKDTVLALAPFEEDEVLRMISSLKGSELLRGFRGAPAKDEEALVELVMKVSAMAYHLKDEILTVDLNPVMVLPRGRGVQIVDVVIIAA